MELLTLNTKNLERLRGRLSTPGYDRSRLTAGIAHIGVGGFHRAHQASYTEAAIAAGDISWGIRGVGLTEKDGAMKAALLAQDCMFTVVARGSSSESAQIIGSLIDYRLSRDSQEQVFEVLTDPRVRIISLTVTENGYCFKDDSGELDFADPGIRSDLKEPSRPRTVIGYLAEALRMIKRDKRVPPTVLSCDNLPHNGKKLRGLIAAYAHEFDRSLAEYIEQEVSFPCTMVDRITPITRESDKKYLKDKYGIADAWPVFCEDYMQWVIEDNFPHGHPDWSILGAQFVSDVSPYESMKIRLLNGSHSALAYLSYLLGHREVDQAMRDPAVRRFVHGYMDELTPTVGQVPGMDLEEYKKTLVERFSNSAIRDQIARLAMDGSRKIPNFIVEPLMELLAQGLRTDHVALALAAWIRFLKGKDEGGETIKIEDPLKEIIHPTACASIRDVRPFLRLKEIFPASLSEHAGFIASVSRYYSLIEKEGIHKALNGFLAKEGSHV